MQLDFGRNPKPQVESAEEQCKPTHIVFDEEDNPIQVEREPGILKLSDFDSEVRQSVKYFFWCHFSFVFGVCKSIAT